MGVASLIDAILGTHVDLSGLDEGLRKAEKMSEDALKKISDHFGLIAVSIGTAIATTVVVALEKAIKTTAEWGLEMEHLSNRMGMTAKEAATLVGVMERFGINAGVAARSMQIMASQARATTEALDPFQTRMGKLLGTLKDTNGNALNMAQILDLARQKIGAASSETQKLQIAQALVGNRMAGQLLPVLKLTNEEWERHKESVESVLGPVDKAAEEALAYKQAMAQLEQTFRGLQVTLGTKLLPTLTEIVHSFTALVKWFGEFKEQHSTLIEILKPWKIFQLIIEGNVAGLTYMAEKLHLVEKGTYEAYKNMQKYQEEARKGALEADKAKDSAETEAEAMERTEKREKELVQLIKERVSLAEKARNLGIGSDDDIRKALDLELKQLEEQRKILETNLTKPGVTADTRLKLETDIAKNRLEAAEAVSRVMSDMYKREEEALKNAKSLGFANIDQEIEYRKKKAAELLGRGDVLGASGEIIKARDLAIKQADEVMEFTKKIRVVSLQSEIEYQKQKLEAIKGNAQEEMKILSSIADLDKQLYSQRLEFGLNYTQNIVDQYNKVMTAAKKSGEVETFERARIDSERQLVEGTREAGQVLHGGGTSEQRQAAVGFAQFVYKQIEQMQQQGQSITGAWRDAADTARDILKAASGGSEVRAPGGPSPTIGSLLSPAEGLATAGLARGSDIPRLDTSFTDLAIRVRDVLLGTIPNFQNLSNAVADAAKRIASITGTNLNPGIIGPGGGSVASPTQGSGQIATSGQTIAPPTVGPGGVPVTASPQVGIGSSGSVVAAISDLKKAIEDGNQTLSEVLQAQSTANQESLAAALSQIREARQKVDVTVGLEPGTGDLMVARLVQELA